MFKTHDVSYVHPNRIGLFVSKLVYTRNSSSNEVNKIMWIKCIQI